MLVSRDAIYQLLKVCTEKKDLAAARHVHSLMVSNGLDSVAVLGDHLIRLFALFGSLMEANIVFCKIAQPSVYTWDAIISSHTTVGENKRAIELFHMMQQDGIKPDKFICVSLFKACGVLGALGEGKLIHQQMIRVGLDSDVVVKSTLVHMYAICGNIDEARRVFDEMPNPDLVAWGAMIAGYARHGHGLPALVLFEKMQMDGIKPDKVTLLCVLKACSSLRAVGNGKLIHNMVVKAGLESDVAIGSTLVDMYAKCENFEEAHKVFNRLPAKNVVAWGAVIAGYARHGPSLLVLDLYEKMHQDGIKPDEVIFLCMLKASSSVGAIAHGKLVHNQILRIGIDSDTLIGNALVDMYAKCSSLEEAHRSFNVMLTKDVVSWNSLLAGYVQHGYGPSALELFEEMQLEGVKPDGTTLSCILKACGSIGALKQGKLIHEQITRIGLGSDAVIGGTLVDMYATFGNLDEARQVFDGLPNRDLTSWNTILSGYAQHGNGISALELFENMHQEDMMPDKVTFLCILKACGSIGALGQGEMVHDLILRRGFHEDLVIGSTIVDMYAKCGSLDEACKVFDGFQSRDEVLWGSMIGGYAQYGNWKLAGVCLEEMQRQGLKPLDTTYTSILAACSHAGQVEVGQQYFKCISLHHGLAPSIEHSNCMVDLLGRAGRLSEAAELLHKTSGPTDTTGWVSLLTACRTYGNTELARQCLDELFLVNPNISSGFVLMSNVFADAYMWEAVQNIQELRKCAGAWKKAGMACVEVNTKAHEFIVADKDHPQSDTIYDKLDVLRKTLKVEGYVPQVDLVTVQL